MIKNSACNHEIDDETKHYEWGKGFVGVCKKCGAPVIQAWRIPVRPRTKPKMSKKERLRERRSEYGREN